MAYIPVHHRFTPGRPIDNQLHKTLPVTQTLPTPSVSYGSLLLQLLPSPFQSHVSPITSNRSYRPQVRVLYAVQFGVCRLLASIQLFISHRRSDHAARYRCIGCAGNTRLHLNLESLPVFQIQGVVPPLITPCSWQNAPTRFLSPIRQKHRLPQPIDCPTL